MFIIKCNGEKFSDGEKCKSEHEVILDPHEVPFGWILINGHIKNASRKAHLIEGNGIRHYCSQECLINSLYKDKEEE